MAASRSRRSAHGVGEPRRAARLPPAHAPPEASAPDDAAALEGCAHREDFGLIKRHLLNGVAHELRTPLTPILLQLEALHTAAEGLSPRERRAFRILARNVERLSLLLQDVLECARMYEGTMTLATTRVDLAEVVAREGASFQRSAARAGVAVAVEARGPLWVTADEARIRRVVLHLLTNAFRATPPGGRVVLKAHRRGRAARVEVQDPGPRVGVGELDALLDPFALGAAGSDGARGGTGLGLHVSRFIVELHGGRIGASSRGRRPGATFWFELPLDAGERGPRAAPVRSGPQPRTGTRRGEFPNVYRGGPR